MATLNDTSQEIIRQAKILHQELKYLRALDPDTWYYSEDYDKWATESAVAVGDALRFFIDLSREAENNGRDD